MGTNPESEYTASVTVISEDGEIERLSFLPSERPDYKVLQGAVKGLIQPVEAYLPDGIQAYANEEGFLRGMTPNRRGTKAVRWPHSIVGPIVILQGFDLEWDEEAEDGPWYASTNVRDFKIEHEQNGYVLQEVIDVGEKVSKVTSRYDSLADAKEAARKISTPPPLDI